MRVREGAAGPDGARGAAVSKAGLLAGAAAGLLAALAGAMGPIAAADPAAPATHGGPFVLTSRAFVDGAVLPFKYTGNFHECHGGNISPPLSWRHVPAGTRSFAVVVFDFDGRAGLGVVHWVVYGIPTRVTALKEGAGAAAGAGFTGGINMQSSPRYAGPCPKPGDSFHHYMFTVYALDLPPAALGPGLSRDALQSAITGHIVAASTLVGRFERK
jgi:Raf kinase inhibitor-like YbhB/YbcL family protein